MTFALIAVLTIFATYIIRSNATTDTLTASLAALVGFNALWVVFGLGALSMFFLVASYAFVAARHILSNTTSFVWQLPNGSTLAFVSA